MTNSEHLYARSSFLRPLDIESARGETESRIFPPQPFASPEGNEQSLLSDKALVAESHARCRRAGIDAGCKRPRDRLSADAFQALAQPYSGLLAYADLLYTDLHRYMATPSAIFLLTTASGHVIHLHSSPEMIARAIGHCGIGPGVSLAEESCGTTAVALASRHLAGAALRGEQHYCSLFRQCCSVAYPICGWDGTVNGYTAIFDHAGNRLGEKLALVRCIAKELNQACLKSPLRCEEEPTSLHTRSDAGSRVALTARQRRVLSLFAGGMSYKQIARTLGLASVKTVEEHLDAVRSKLGVTHRRQCIQRATELGLLDTEHLAEGTGCQVSLKGV